MIFHCAQRSHPPCPLADIFYPPYPPIASQLISRDVHQPGRGPSEAARCVSTEDHQAPSPPLLSGRDDMMHAVPQHRMSYPYC